ncbi:putative uncharacterised protein family UPF0052 [Lyophyllum shimeji]|uniref:Uncharacterized protein n=1 Tax=Lyophyllum shimeji TaxID=47721 RepID=A0A9P3UJ68_LYOSH|nr:putative uncharacterised protein family UPF0052 [Lyophyllum shimeji]
MLGRAQNDASYGLTLPVSRQGPGLDSPGSSVFDLPIQGTAPKTADNTPSPGRHASHQQELQQSPDDVQETSPSFVVISGGTGGNAICSAFDNATYVLPVSDDGGSSSEIIRVLGGPSIGDIRSRLIRLIPYAPPNSPLDAIRRLLAYRLPARCSEREAREEWREIVEGRSRLWIGIPNDRKETIRGFLVYFESELLKRAHKNFDFRNGSIGNYFLAAAQEFFRSLPSAVFLFSSITNSQANILPVIVTNHTVTIAAELEDGRRLVGQCEISHPVPQDPAPVDITICESDPLSPVDGMGEFIAQRQNMMFESASKADFEPLGSRISRLFYINAYGIEIHPSPNQDYLSALASKDVLVYSCGSLWTSIIPCLALRGVAAGIARSSSLRAKILLLNFNNDRETDGYTAADYIQAMVRTLNASYQTLSYGLGNANTTYPISAFVTHLVYLRGSKVLVDVEHIHRLGVRCTELASEDGHATSFNADLVRGAIKEILLEMEEGLARGI